MPSLSPKFPQFPKYLIRSYLQILLMQVPTKKDKESFLIQHCKNIFISYSLMQIEIHPNMRHMKTVLHLDRRRMQFYKE